MEEMSRKKKNIIVIISYSIILLLGLIIGFLFKHFLNTYSFLYIFLISFPFSILTYSSYLFSFMKQDKNEKGSILFLLYIARFISVIIAFLLSALYLYLNNLTKTDEIYFIIIVPVIFTFTYLLVLILK